MDASGQFENSRYNPDYYSHTHPTQQIKERNNVLVMKYRIMSLLSDRNEAIQERDNALSEKRKALAKRDKAVEQRDKAVSERDQALMERDSILATLRFHENFQNALEEQMIYAFPVSTIPPDKSKSKKTKEGKRVLSKPMEPTKKGSKKKAVEDLNRGMDLLPGKKHRAEWESTDIGLILVNFDETTMPVPVCTCTGMPHQCYRWGKGGWQSACCTTTLSQYPLPHMPNKRYSRMVGRKMSGIVFTRLLSRLAAKGHDLSVPVDLKDYWARHGTNRYIIIQ